MVSEQEVYQLYRQGKLTRRQWSLYMRKSISYLTKKEKRMMSKYNSDKVGLRHDWSRMITRISYGKEYRQRTRPIRSFFRIVWTHGRKLSYWTAK